MGTSCVWTSTTDTAGGGNAIPAFAVEVAWQPAKTRATVNRMMTSPTRTSFEPFISFILNTAITIPENRSYFPSTLTDAPNEPKDSRRAGVGGVLSFKPRLANVCDNRERTRDSHLYTSRA